MSNTLVTTPNTANGCHATTLTLVGTSTFEADMATLVTAKSYTSDQGTMILKASDGYRATMLITLGVGVKKNKNAGICFRVGTALGGMCHAILNEAATDYQIASLGHTLIWYTKTDWSDTTYPLNTKGTKQDKTKNSGARVDPTGIWTAAVSASNTSAATKTLTAIWYQPTLEDTYTDVVRYSYGDEMYVYGIKADNTLNAC